MSEFELKIHSRDIETLQEIIEKKHADKYKDIVQKAYEYSLNAHKDQFRLSGEPYIIHPLEVAITLAKLNLDISSILAGLLHDVVEDTEVSLEILTNKFGEDVAMLVDGVTKISSIKNKSKAAAQAETLRKMLLATSKDLRIIIIKLSDKLHNMRTIQFQKEYKQHRIALETLEIYAPIARRLGMTRISSELEDISFHVLYEGEYNHLKEKISQKVNEIDKYIEQVRIELTKQLAKQNLDVRITGRSKHYFSIFRKMKLQNKSFEEIYDIRAIRIITEDIKDCYATLGIIHSLWTPVTSRFKDYIAVPKSNMYQSLHTSVIGPGGFSLEIQIRTKEMDKTAEMGVAAHWLYKESSDSQKKDTTNISLFKNIKSWETEETSTREFMQALKMDLYDQEIFIFTPKGKIIKLAKDSTPLDFAYAIHTEVGHKTNGAKVNNKIVPLKSKLHSGDIVEILTSKTTHPTKAWLKIVKSPNARYKIRSWLKRQEEQKTDDQKKKKILEKTISVTISNNDQKKLKKSYKTEEHEITVDGSSDIMIKLPQCCQPIPGDDVIGFITRGRGITVHKKDCSSIKHLKNEKERFIEILWENKEKKSYPVKIKAIATDRADLLKDLTDVLSSFNINIIKVDAQILKNKKAEFKVIIEVKSQNHLTTIINAIKAIQNIEKIFKLNEKVVLK